MKKEELLIFWKNRLSPKTSLISTACYIFPHKVLNVIPEFLAQSERGKDAMGYFCSWLLKKKKIPMHSFLFLGHLVLTLEAEIPIWQQIDIT